jgi:hypothetical protein
MPTCCRVRPSLLLLCVLAAAAPPASPARAQAPAGPFAAAAESRDAGIVQVKGTVPLAVAGTPVAKRFVIRYPATAGTARCHRRARRIRRQQLRPGRQCHRHR